MTQFTRRDLGRIAALAVPSLAMAKPNSVVRGVMIGAQSYSFRDRSLDEAIKAYEEIGIGFCELWEGHVTPKGSREDTRKFRLETPLSVFEDVRKKFDRAGIKLVAFNYSFRDDFTDAEIARGFEITKALGLKAITASSNVSTAARVYPFARKAGIVVAMHNHSNVKPNEFATPDNFAEARKGMADFIKINLDIGHFTAANFDAVKYLEENHQDIVTLHLKDRKKNQGPNMPFGEGETPIKEVLQLLAQKKYKIPANIEYEYKGADTVAEVKKCFEFCKQALA